MSRKTAPARGRIARARLAASVMVYGLSLFAPAAADPPPWAPAPGQRVHKNGAPHNPAAQQLAYRLPQGLRDGRCRPEMLEPTAGGLVSAAAGAPFGKNKGTLAATAVGALIAAAVGRPASHGIARQEEICFSQSFEHVPDRGTVAWMDPVEGVHYAVTPTKTAKAADGRYCREYEARATVNGQAAGTYGTACRQPDGRWELVN
jgi:surface antigen